MSSPAAELIGRARELAPLLARQAAAAERARKPADEVIDALREARVFDLMVPRRYGGLELDLDTYLEVGLALSEGDASMAWVATFYIEHNWMLCQFPETFQRDLYADRSHILAPASLAPDGQVESVDGGLCLRGRWNWGAGWPPWPPRSIKVVRFCRASPKAAEPAHISKPTPFNEPYGMSIHSRVTRSSISTSDWRTTGEPFWD